MQVLFETENLLLRYHEGSSYDLLVITFAPYYETPGKHIDGFGEKFLTSEGIAHIHITCGDNRWYQYPELPEIGPATEKIRTQYREVTLYGGSMGGYGAFIAARWLNPTRIIAYAPQYSADPGKIPFDPYWFAYGRNIEWIWDDITLQSGTKAVIGFDSQHVDAKHAYLIQQHTGAALLKLPYAGHLVPDFLKEIGVIRALTVTLLSGLDYSCYFEKIKKLRGSSSNYWQSLAIAGGNAKSKIACLQRAATIDPSRSDIYYRLGETLLSSGRPSEAIDSYDQFLRLRPDTFWILHRKATACRQVGDLVQAITCARRSVELEPKIPGILLLFGMLLGETGEHQASAGVLAKLTALEPENHYFWHLLSRELSLSGNFTAALRPAVMAERLAPKAPLYRQCTDELLEELAIQSICSPAAP